MSISAKLLRIIVDPKEPDDRMYWAIQEAKYHFGLELIPDTKKKPGKLAKNIPAIRATKHRARMSPKHRKQMQQAQRKGEYDE